MARNARLLTTGITGSVVTLICCFTPALVWLFAVLGVSAWLAWIDYVLWPSLFVFLAITAYAVMQRRS